jgi:hypothetical protein
MNTRLRRGLLIGAIHVALVAGTGAKFAIDRATLPRVWVRADAIDPDRPIRGRYLSLRLELAGSDVALPSLPEPQPMPEGRTYTPRAAPVPVALEIRNQQLVAVPPRSGYVWLSSIERGDQRLPVLNDPVAYFIPHSAVDPARREPGEELWVEVSVPHRGSPRPIRLGVKNGGVLTPLEMR